LISLIEEMLEGGVLRKGFKAKKEKLAGGLKELQNAEIYCFKYTSPKCM
jgi:hypothetical protein